MTTVRERSLEREALNWRRSAEVLCRVVDRLATENDALRDLVTLRTPSEADPSVSDPTETPKVPDSTGSMTTGSDE